MSEQETYYSIIQLEHASRQWRRPIRYAVGDLHQPVFDQPRLAIEDLARGIGIAARPRDELELLGDAIAQLPDDEREILTMIAMAEMNSTQVAEALGLPAGTVRYKLHQARRRLYDAVAGEGA